jgi:hypothetical protein
MAGFCERGNEPFPPIKCMLISLLGEELLASRALCCTNQSLGHDEAAAWRHVDPKLHLAAGQPTVELTAPDQ